MAMADTAVAVVQMAAAFKGAVAVTEAQMLAMEWTEASGTQMKAVAGEEMASQGDGKDLK